MFFIIQATTVGLEPLEGQRSAAVASVIVKLPTGGEDDLVYGCSGLAIGSTLVTISEFMLLSTYFSSIHYEASNSEEFTLEQLLLARVWLFARLNVKLCVNNMVVVVFLVYLIFFKLELSSHILIVTIDTKTR